MDVMWLRQRYRYDRHVQLAAEESEEMEVDGESGREPMWGKLVGLGNGIGRAVASETAEKSGQGLDDENTGKLGCFRCSGFQL